MDHAQFGQGTVINSQVGGGDEIVTVAFEGMGLKRLVASFGTIKKMG